MVKIAIIGPESTGKSVLAAQLAAHFGEQAVEEYSREYLATLPQRYTLDDVVNIAEGQQKAIDNKAKNYPSVLIADTEIIVCKVWTEYVFHHTPRKIEELLKKQYFDIYLLCNIDLPWTFDPLRENPSLEEREEIFHLYQRILNDNNLPYGIVCGNGESRFNNALSIIKPYLHE